MPGRGDIKAIGDFEPIVSEEIWNAVNSARGPSQAKSRKSASSDFPLRGTIRCSRCGYSLTASRSKGRSKHYAYYTCWNSDCKAVKVKQEVMESQYEVYLDSISIAEPILDLFEAAMLALWKDRNSSESKLRELANKNLLKATKRLEVLTDQFLDGHCDAEFFQSQKSRLEYQIETLEIQSGSNDVKDKPIQVVLNHGRNLFSDVRSTWNRMKPELRPAFASSLNPEGLLSDGVSLGTAEKPWFERLIPSSADDVIRLAVPTGFEPVSPP